MRVRMDVPARIRASVPNELGDKLASHKLLSACHPILPSGFEPMQTWAAHSAEPNFSRLRFITYRLVQFRCLVAPSTWRRESVVTSSQFWVSARA